MKSAPLFSPSLAGARVIEKPAAAARHISLDAAAGCRGKGCRRRDAAEQLRLDQTQRKLSRAGRVGCVA
ncbi:MAG: hypothetical protein J7M14_06555, partial [Planctomycetes bacterium]|nr:hypothetical protein [Planctomycetota bacterium]